MKLNKFLIIAVAAAGIMAGQAQAQEYGSNSYDNSNQAQETPQFVKDVGGFFGKVFDSGVNMAKSAADGTVNFAKSTSDYANYKYMMSKMEDVVKTVTPLAKGVPLEVAEGSQNALVKAKIEYTLETNPKVKKEILNVAGLSKAEADKAQKLISDTVGEEELAKFRECNLKEKAAKARTVEFVQQNGNTIKQVGGEAVRTVSKRM